MKKVLKAGAGTGKTFRLSLEYIRGLLSGQDFNEIVVLTFTRKATAEARARIISHLNELIEEEKNSIVWQELNAISASEPTFDRQRLAECRRQMLLNKDAVQIYTIDSFTNQLFKEMVAPYLSIYDYEIIEPQENRAIIEETFRRLLQNSEDFDLLQRVLGVKVGRAFSKPFNFIRSIIDERWKYLLADHERRGKYDNTDYLTPLKKVLDLLADIADRKDKTLDENWFVKDFRDFGRDFKKLREQPAGDKRLKKYIYKFHEQILKKDRTLWNGQKTRGKDFACAREELQLFYEEFREKLAREVFNREIRPLESDLFELADKVFAVYDRLKKRKQKFTYSDISNSVYRYLIRGQLPETETNLRDLLEKVTGSEVSSLFIDEFQDTSVLQWRIIEPFVDDRRNFIAVGDAKQSIYQWRGGEKELFVRLPEFISSSVEDLPICYRSDREIVDFLNEFFTDIHQNWDYSRVSPHDNADRGMVEVLLGGSGAEIDEESKKFASYGEEKRENIKAQNRELTKDMPRDIAGRLADFENYAGTAVLARTNKQLYEIAEHLEELGVPHVLHQKRELAEHQAIWPIFQLLKFLWQEDYHNLLNFLRSDLIGITHENLKVLMNNFESVRGFFAGKEGLKDHEIDENILKLLEWTAELKSADYQKLVYRIISESGVFKLYSGERSALKNLFRLYSLMMKAESLPEFMEIYEEKKGSGEFQEAIVQHEEAVDLLTIHRSKGLSFHTEFFYWKPNSGRGGRREEELEFYLKFQHDYQKIDSYLLTTSRYSDVIEFLDYDFEEERNQKELVEEINNVYVAMSRAGKNLFIWMDVPAQIMPGEISAWENSSDRYRFYEDALSDACSVRSLSELIKGKKMGEFVPPQSVDKEDSIVQEQNLDELAELFRPGGLSGEKIEAGSFAAKKQDIDLDLSREKERLMGLAVHYYLENIKYGSAEEKRRGRRLVAARYGNILGDELVEEVFSRAESFIKEYPQYLSERWEVFTEYEPVSGEDDLTETENGARIDRLLLDRNEKEIIILDFKTGLERSEEQLQKYRNLIAEEAGEDYSIKAEFVQI